MKIFSLACAAACALAFAAATASSSFAESTTPGAAPPTRTGPKVTPPPRGRELDKFTTRTQPPGDKAALPKPGGPAVVDDFASGIVYSKAHGGSTCYPDAGPNCVASLDKICTAHGGGMRTNPDGSVTCVES